MSADLWYHPLDKDEKPPSVGDIVFFEELGFPYHFSVTVTFRPGDPDDVDFSTGWNKDFANNTGGKEKDYFDYHEYYYGNENSDGDNDQDSGINLKNGINFLDYVDDQTSDEGLTSTDPEKDKLHLQKAENSANMKAKSRTIGISKLHSIISSRKLHQELNTSVANTTKTFTKLDKSRDSKMASSNSSAGNNGPSIFDGLNRTAEGSVAGQRDIDSHEDLSKPAHSAHSLSDITTQSRDEQTVGDNSSFLESVTQSPVSPSTSTSTSTKAAQRSTTNKQENHSKKEEDKNSLNDIVH